jgi:hypothetical protein
MLNIVPGPEVATFTISGIADAGIPVRDAYRFFIVLESPDTIRIGADARVGSAAQQIPVSADELSGTSIFELRRDFRRKAEQNTGCLLRGGSDSACATSTRTWGITSPTSGKRRRNFTKVFGFWRSGLITATSA